MLLNVPQKITKYLKTCLSSFHIISTKKKEITEVLTKFDGSKSKIYITKKEKIGSGGYATIYRVEGYTMGIHGKHPLYFAIKEFHTKYPRGYVNQYLETHHILKQNDIPTRNTCRKTEDNKRIFITLGNHSDNIIIGTNKSSDRNATLGIRIDKDSVYKELVSQVFEIIQKASNTKLVIPNDAYFLIYNQKDLHYKVLVGDLDLIKQSTIKNEKELLVVNADMFLRAIHSLQGISDSLKDKLHQAYLSFMKKKGITLDI